jgi:carboxyl-terminal processing protease
VFVVTKVSNALAMVFLLALSTVPSCSPSSPPEEIFDTVWDTFDQRYALFEVKSIDWRALYDVYRPRVTPETSDEELFNVLTDMMSHLYDNHVMLTAKPLGRDFSAGYLGGYFEEMGLTGAMEFLRARPLPERYFRDKPRAAGEERFQYGWVGDGIGYLHFGGFEDEAGSAAAVDEILAELAGARALIVDVRNNSGGDDRVGKLIADRFADQKRLYMVTRDRIGPGHGDFAEPKYWHVDPAKRTFTGSVILLTSRLSISGAENFALAMRVLPHVTVVGDTTSGCFADMVWFDLPNGWRYSLSRNLFVDYSGRCWEGIGVPPDVVVRGEHRDGDSDGAFETALELLQDDGPPLQDESASAAAVRHNLVETLARGLESGGFDEARMDFDREKRELATESWYVYSRDINALGYRMLADERFDDAIGVFELYVELLPQDANSYDSLGEAFMKRGDTEEAIANYERSLELNPDNDNAVQMLDKLRQ